MELRVKEEVLLEGVCLACALTLLNCDWVVVGECNLTAAAAAAALDET